MKRTLFSFILFITSCLLTWAQGTPVHFSVNERKTSTDEVELVFAATIDKGWHVFGTNVPTDGPTPTTINIEQLKGAKAIGSLIVQGQEKEELSMAFGMTLRFYEQSVTFRQKFRLTGGDYHIKGYLQYATCSARMCMPPTNVEFDF